MQHRCTRCVELKRIWTVKQIKTLFNRILPLATVCSSSASLVRSRVCALCPASVAAGETTAGREGGSSTTTAGLGHGTVLQAPRALVVPPVRFGTMLRDSRGRLVWRATWILFFSALINSTGAQGKRDAGSAPSRLVITKGPLVCVAPPTALSVGSWRGRAFPLGGIGSVMCSLLFAVRTEPVIFPLGYSDTQTLRLSDTRSHWRALAVQFKLFSY